MVLYEWLYKTGRKTKVIDEYTERLITGIRDTHPLSGPIAIENYLMESGIKVSQNIIYRVLLKYNMVDQSINKIYYNYTIHRPMASWRG